MKTRMRFTKTGSLKFIGHLDCMRFIQKAIRRAGLDVSYSKGFSPHQIMSFASPLGVGLTSDGEYIDIEFESLSEEDEAVIRQLNECMTDEIFITEIHRMGEKSKSSMALLRACDYLVSLRDGTTFSEHTVSASSFSLADSFPVWMEQEHIPVIKKTKRSEMEVDLKPFILQYAFSKEEFEQKTGEKMPHLHNEYDSEEELYVRLVSGSAANIKPELVLEAYVNSLNQELEPYCYQIHRIQMIFEKDGGNKGGDNE